jgi:signal transduction histidine kinase
MPRWPQRDSLVLLAGALSAAALLFAAFGLVRAPQEAGEAALARAAGDVADTVVAEWARLLRSEPPPFEVAGSVHLLDEPFGEPSGELPALAVEAETFELDAPAAGGTAVSALLAEAQRLELAGSLPQALDAALQAVSAASSPGPRARSRLRALQLSVRVGRADVAREQWDAARGELLGNETLDGCSALLLCGLAAAQAFDEAGRDALATVLLERCRAGELSWPETDGRLVLDVGDPRLGSWVSPRAEAYVERCAALAPGRSADFEARSAQHAEVRAARAVRELIDRLDAGSPGRDRWTATPVADGLLLLARRRDDGAILAFIARDVQRRLLQVLAERSLVPEGFRVNLVGADDSTRGPAEILPEVVRARTSLVGDALGFVVRHVSPGIFVGAERARARWTRVALVVMAGFSVLAAVSTARAMRREQALAGLRSAFVASVSHELRTPVSSILLLVENLESGRAGGGRAEDRQRYHTLLRREAQRLRRIVDDVLDMSRLERGQPIELRRELVDVPALVAELADEARAHAGRTGTPLLVTIGALPEQACFDTDAVRRALLNLVDNAVKHGRKGGTPTEARAALELHIEATAGGGLLVALADRGPGVPAVARERIFEPFARGAADGSGPPGAGLGLSIVRAIARGHGGDVAVRDRDQGPGAVFEMRLPPGDEEGAA